MKQNQLISLTQKYPTAQFNLLGNTDVAVQVPDIMTPVAQAIKLSPNPNDGDVYVQQGKLAITKNGLKKLADGAGIKMVASEHVIPSTCQKCAAVNAQKGAIVQCGNCRNRDVAYHVTISVPQLTGEVLTVEDTHEIIVDSATAGMSDKQKAEFMKHLPQICEAKALNGAIRTALHIKGTYTKEELAKPFVVAYLVPNLDHEDIKQAAISNMFDSTSRLFGKPKPLAVSQIESRVPEVGLIEASDGENYDQYVDGTYQQIPEQEYYEPAPQPQANQPIPAQNYQAQPLPPQQNNQQSAVYQCVGCGAAITEKVYAYSNEKMGRPLCYECQKAEKAARGWR